MTGLSHGRRRPDPRPEPAEDPGRASAQRHLDARLARLRAYAAALEAAAATRQPDERLAQLERQLELVRRDVRAAERPRLPAHPVGPRPPAGGSAADPAGGAAPGGGSAAATAEPAARPT